MNMADWERLTAEERDHRLRAYVDWYEAHCRRIEENVRMMAGRRWLRRREIRAQFPTLDLIDRDGGLREAPEFRPRVFGYRVSARAMAERVKHDYLPPRGWVCLRDVDSTGRRDVFRVGPLWLLAPGVFRRWVYYSFCMWAMRVGLAREPYEGCYFHELVWFPDFPKFGGGRWVVVPAERWHPPGFIYQRWVR